MSDLISTALHLRAQLDGLVGPELPRHLTWPARVRSVGALVAELDRLEDLAALAASSSRMPDVAEAGRWLDARLEELAAELASPTLAGVGAALVALAAADESLARLVAGRRAP